MGKRSIAQRQQRTQRWHSSVVARVSRLIPFLSAAGTAVTTGSVLVLKFLQIFRAEFKTSTV